jgi:hypothetical protein
MDFLNSSSQSLFHVVLRDMFWFICVEGVIFSFLGRRDIVILVDDGIKLLVGQI